MQSGTISPIASYCLKVIAPETNLALSGQHWLAWRGDGVREFLSGRLTIRTAVPGATVGQTTDLRAHPIPVAMAIWTRVTSFFESGLRSSLASFYSGERRELLT
jgi:hypothetical protein